MTDARQAQRQCPRSARLRLPSEPRGVHPLQRLWPYLHGHGSGSGGLGARLRKHHNEPPRQREWIRFSWFTFDDVIDVPGAPGWEQGGREVQASIGQLRNRDREIEALLIQVLGTTQNRMQFQRANKWDQPPDYEAQVLKYKGVVDQPLF